MKPLRPIGSWILILSLLLPMLAACSVPSAATLAPVVPTAEPFPEPTVPVPTPVRSPEPPAPPQPTTVPEPTPAPQGRFEAGPCRLDLPAGQIEAQTIECGTLVVPEDRDNPSSPTLRLAVAILHPEGTPEPDPIVYLEGGPGASALEFLFLTFKQQFEPLLASRRDIILFDQRGVGLSEPALDCPGLQELGLELLDEEVNGRRIGEEEALDMVRDATLACRAELARTAELSAYNTEASAADVEDLRLALGYDRINLWGASYGTWLALEVMRRYPEGLRAAILDSVYPPDRDLLAEAPVNAGRAIDLLFEACSRERACNGAFPDLRSVFDATVERLDGAPARFEVLNPLTRKRYDVLMTGDNLVQMLFQFLYSTSVIPSLPQILHEAGQGTYTAIAQLFGSLLVSGEAVSRGQRLSVLCRDEIAFSSPDEFEALLAEEPQLAHAFDDSILGELGLELCDDWRVGRADDILNEPVTSGVPTLILTGEFDPITPPMWGRHVAGTLSNSFCFEYPGVGHGASAVQGCPQQMMIAFLDDPAAAPNHSCLADMESWEFAVPSAVPPTIEWIPFANEAMGIQGLVPRGWTEAQTGVYARGAFATDPVALLLQAMPGTSQGLLDLLTGQLGLAIAPEALSQRQANGLTWGLYRAEVQGMSVDFALADSQGLGLAALLQSNAGERDALYESVYLPAIDALVPIP